mmetsp:Transcript_56389/g.167835  ORF Transcript_56389/g.167835 Transcript_56389/m.167835 type:complete len:307 (+) Transcript_56389:50-970(+)
MDFQIRSRPACITAVMALAILGLPELLPCALTFHAGRWIGCHPGLYAKQRQCRAQRVLGLCGRLASGGEGRRGEPADLGGSSGLALHLYDHCPYCTRVELVLGWRGLSYRRVVYGYADVEGPTTLTGTKVLPVLEWTDTSGQQQCMGESIDIIHAVDCMDGPEARIVLPKAGRKDLNVWQRRLRRVMHRLTRPRLLRMPIADFATPADRQYQMDKYTARGFDYEASLASTDELMPKVEKILSDFDPLLRGDASLNGKGWSWDDLHTLPSLRVLTCVSGLRWPARTLRYVEEAHARAGVQLYSEHAC